MKKIIAAAVATAFVAPAMAADVSLGGFMGFKYVDAKNADSVINTHESEIIVNASEELPNGYSIAATLKMVDDNGETTENEELDMQGSAMTISGPVGSVTVGDTSGALDNVGDYSDVSPAGGEFNGDGDDHALLWVLPTFVEGLKVSYSYSPTGDNNMGAGTGVTNNATAYSASYDFAGGQVYAGKEEDGTSDSLEAYGIKYTVAGITLAAESANEKTSGSTFKIGGMAATYSFGDIDLMYEAQTRKAESGGAYTKDESVVSVNYNFGSVDLYASFVDVDESESGLSSDFGSTVDTTVVGVKYAF